MRKLLAKVEPAANAAALQLGLSGAELEPLSGAVPVVQVSFSQSERLPIYVTDAGTQLLCIAYLFQERDLKLKSRTL